MMRLRCGDDLREVDVRPDARGTRVMVDGVVFSPAVQELSPGTYVLREGEGGRTFHCVRDGDTIHVWWDGVAYRLREERPSGRGAARHAEASLAAPMPGRVIAVKVAPGRSVTRGEELVVVESMKMENALRAPRDGVVKAVSAAEGDMVGPGQVLVELA
jgi:3-methylcrotonyl-CoA carboxylase alpha subunit